MMVGSAWRPVRPILSEDLPLRDGSRIGDSIEWLRWDDSETERRQRASEALRLDYRRSELPRALGQFRQQLSALQCWLAELGSPEEQAAAAKASAEREAAEQRRVDQELRERDVAMTKAALDEARARVVQLEQHLGDLEVHDHARA
jgi:hypothetical protein